MRRGVWKSDSRGTPSSASWRTAGNSAPSRSSTNPLSSKRSCARSDGTSRSPRRGSPHGGGRRQAGIRLQGNQPPETYGRIGQLAEEYAFDVLSAFSHLMYQAALVPLMAAALNPRRIRRGPACVNPFTLHPVG